MGGGTVGRSRTVSDARLLLGDAGEWLLSPARWERVDAAVEMLATGVENADLATVQQAVEQMERAGPGRAVSGRCPPEKEPGPVSEKLRLRIVKLVDRLDDPRLVERIRENERSDPQW